MVSRGRATVDRLGGKLNLINKSDVSRGWQVGTFMISRNINSHINSLFGKLTLAITADYSCGVYCTLL